MRKTLRFLLVAKFERTFASLPCISATQVVDLRPVKKVGLSLYRDLLAHMGCYKISTFLSQIFIITKF